jgi:hypothetical protein
MRFRASVHFGSNIGLEAVVELSEASARGRPQGIQHAPDLGWESSFESLEDRGLPIPNLHPIPVTAEPELYRLGLSQSTATAKA